MAPSAVQIIIVILLIMVIFGAGRIPTIMENLAKGINSFKKGLKDEADSEGGQSKFSKANESKANESKANESDKENE